MRSERVASKVDLEWAGKVQRIFVPSIAASIYYLRRADQLIERAKDGKPELMAQAQRWLTLADIYFAYEPVFKYVVRCGMGRWIFYNF